MFITDKSNIFNEMTSYSSTDKLIYIAFNNSADFYIYKGILCALETYRDRYLENSTFNEVDYILMNSFDY